MIRDDRSGVPLPIQTDALRGKLFDTSVPDEELAKYMLLDPGESRAFAPVVRVNPALIQPPPAGIGLASALQGALALGGLNSISRWRRNQVYRARISGGWTGLRLVSEGDSWFQFPFLLKDVIDHLSEDHAILSLGSAGDTLDDIITQDEIVTAVLAERPHAVLLSGGGNDLVGGGNLAAVLRPFAPGLDAPGHITPAFDAVLAEVVGHVRTIAFRVISAAPDVPIVIHTYDHAIPSGGRWLGRPLASLGITDPTLQRGVVRLMIDRWAEALAGLSAEPRFAGRLHVVDCRGTVPDDGWADELHPVSTAYGRVAQKFEAVIRSVTGAVQPSAALGALGTLRRPAPADDALGATVMALAERFDETVLLAEVGRRASLERAGPVALMMAMPRDDASVPESSLSGGYSALRQLGARILTRAHRELHGLLCGSDDADTTDREALRDAFNLGQGALAGVVAGLLSSGPLGLTAFVASPVAALIVRRFLAPSWEETCALWTEKLDGNGTGDKSRAGTARGSLGIARHGLMQEARNESHFCVAFRKDPSAAEQAILDGSKAAVLNSAKWPFNAVIRVRFLEGSERLRERVAHHARSWVGPDMAALTLRFVEEGDAEIRIAFAQGNGSWSLLGTECRNEPDQTKPTMNFGWLTDASGEDEIRKVVLHEFGHALGLIHEHQNPDGGIEWDEAAVIADLSGPPNFWNAETIRHNVLRHYVPAGLIATGIDPLSIMMYPIPERWTVGDFETGLNADFSPTDRELIRRAYPAI